MLRSRPVQVVLGATLVVQSAALASGAAKRGETIPAPPVLEAAIVTSAPATPVVEVAVASMEKDADAKALAIAEKYRKKGYRVPDTLAKQIHAAASAHDIEPEIAFGLVAVESGFRRTARSHVGATGLAQLMPATARWLEPGTTRRQLEDPETNLRLGFRYLRDMIDRYDGDTRLALLAYNRGPGTVDRVLRRGGNPDNGYPRKVMGR